MAKQKLNESFVSDKPATSRIIKNTFVNRLNSLFGFKVTNKAKNSFERDFGISFTKFDINSQINKSVSDAPMGALYNNVKLTDRLSELFDAYLTETTTSYSSIADRKDRLNKLYFFYCNNAFGYRVPNLVADEATQLDVQNRIISIESENPLFVQKTYELLYRWGISQELIHGAAKDIELYGEAIWTHKIGLNGIEKVTQRNVQELVERLEFNPIDMATKLEQMNINRSTGARQEKINKLVDLMKQDDAVDFCDNYSEMLETRLLGYEFSGDIFIPPWGVTHFRFDADYTCFKPYGTPPLLACLAPFQSLIVNQSLQGLAKANSFPITLYKVKCDGMNPARAFTQVQTVKDEYDNIGVSIGTSGNEPYANNTKVWLPEGLVDIDIKSPTNEVNYDEMIEKLKDDIGYSTFVPKGYLTQEYSGLSAPSGFSLTQQYKPFGRHVFQIQSIILKGIGDLIRLHYAITGEFDYNEPFILSMRFPSEEETSERRQAQQETLEMAEKIVDLLKNALSIGEDDSLPEEIIRDVMNKYTFLDPSDLKRWLSNKNFELAKMKSEENDDEEGDGRGGIDGDDFPSLDDSDNSGSEENNSEEASPELPEGDIKSRREVLKKKKLLKEYQESQKRLKEERLKQLKEQYREKKESIYFEFLRENHMTEFVNNNNSSNKWSNHCCYIQPIDENSWLNDTIKVFKETSPNKGKSRLTEAIQNLPNTSFDEDSFSKTMKELNEESEMGGEI